MIVKSIRDLTEEEKHKIINRNKMNLEEIIPTVKEILENVKNRGDEALNSSYFYLLSYVFPPLLNP